MRVVIQRVSKASVVVEEKIVGEIGSGFVVLLGVSRDDQASDADYLTDKIINLRVFSDQQGKMNLSLADTGGALLVVSQFTLYGDARKGRRPSYLDAAPPAIATPRYEQFLALLRVGGAAVETGEFGAMMDVELVNDGPVTLWLER